MMSNFEKEIEDFLYKHLQIKVEKTIYFEWALTHKSYYQNIWKGPKDDYESLEFLGDAFIYWAVSELLFAQDKTAENMTKVRQQIVQSKSLIFTAKKIGLDSLIRIGPSLRNQMPESIVEDVYEAFIAAIFLTCGYSDTKRFVVDTLWKSFVTNDFHFVADYKTFLQEIAHQRFQTKVLYQKKIRVVDGKKIFLVSCWINEHYFANAEHPKLKEAENVCAKLLISQLSKENKV